MDVVNPSTGTRIKTYDEHTESDVTEALDRATETFDDWHTRPIRDRENLFEAAGEVLRENTGIRRDDDSGDGKADHTGYRRSREVCLGL